MTIDSHPDSSRVYRSCRAVICEDSADVREVLGFLLRDAGYEVEEVADGRAALHAIKHSTVDILLLDLSMPKMDGFQVLDYLHEHRPGLPVVVMTGLDPDEIERHLTRMKQADLPPMVLKPVEAPKLLALMELAMEKRIPTGDEATEPTDGAPA